MYEIYKSGNGQRLFRLNFCGYLDILGFSQKINESDLKFFSKYLTVLDTELKYIEDKHDLLNKEGLKKFELKIFTDNFVFCHPQYDDSGESELGNIFEVLSHIQFTFAKADIFVRGAISMSNLYMDKDIVLGPALIEAYNLEKDKAINPRIILSQKVIEVLNKHIHYYSDHKASPQSQEYLIDIDGNYFVNYLFILFYDYDLPSKKLLEELVKHKRPVVKNLKIHKNNYKLFEKYAWIASYHNHFCLNFVRPRLPTVDLKKILISEKLYRKTIKSIV
ncbi:hypothetical protein [Mucilaginibacter ginkgonis]|uniref:Uncharacterized protein n=1 Tax=Mucilaginibacter ginkgonis TaxID=2682091 RepID=A0A6I4I042_9SPHI|nr:hypothetical protein [Mucilaginibacter ginkgonis]QQL49896.1 hypothetical protein GO620_000145 [Mucilaginibacter ginkgonis]